MCGCCSHRTGRQTPSGWLECQQSLHSPVPQCKPQTKAGTIDRPGPACSLQYSYDINHTTRQVMIGFDVLGNTVQSVKCVLNTFQPDSPWRDSAQCSNSLTTLCKHSCTVANCQSFFFSLTGKTVHRLRKFTFSNHSLLR